jgi:enoyl-CoA hydratase/carnithine racemase
VVRTDALADRLARLPTAAVRAAKRAVWAAVDRPLPLGLALERDLARALAR